MERRTRRLLLLCFVGIFAAVAVILLLYARGFRVDLSTQRVFRTGSLVVSSEPTRALIFLNNQLIKQRTNGAIEFLSPGVYDVRIARNGYTSRTYSVTVRAGESTFLEDVELYDANLDRSERVVSSDVSWMAQDPLERRLLFATSRNGSTQLSSINTSRFGDTAVVSALATLPSESVQILSWDLRLSRVLLSYAHGPARVVVELNIDTGELINLSERFPDRAWSHVVFDDSSNPLLYALEDGSGLLYQMDTEMRRVKQLRNEVWIDLAIYDARLWLLDKDRRVFQIPNENVSADPQEVAVVSSVREHRFELQSSALVLKTSERYEIFFAAKNTISRQTIPDLAFRGHVQMRSQEDILAVDSSTLLDVDATAHTVSTVTRTSNILYDATYSPSSNAIFISDSSGVVARDRDRTATYEPSRLIERPLRQLFWNAAHNELFGLDDSGVVYSYHF